MYRKIGMIVLCVMVFASVIDAAETVIELPRPEINKGKPLMQVLALRKSSREFSDVAISDQMLANILWAANGVNRPERNGRTAPSACDLQEVDIYIARTDGLFLYLPKENAIKKISSEDMRESAGKQDFTEEAPINLIYVVDYDSMNHPIMDDNAKAFYAATDTGFVSQNVYLFCASEGLATVVLGWIDKKTLRAKMGLGDRAKIMLTQPIGYPKKEE
jgi:nitroreductase